MTTPPTAALSADNPFLAPSSLPFEAPPFDRIHDADFQPAIEEGMRRHLAEVAAIAEQDAPPTFENTIAAMERAGALLTRVLRVFSALTQSNTNPTLQQVEEDAAPRLAAHEDAIYLDARLFARIEALYDRRDALGLTAEQRELVDRYHRDFVRAGARLDEAGKERLRALNQEESRLTTEFRSRLLAATRAGAVVVEDRARLAGLSDGELAAAAAAADERGLAGKYVLLLQNTTQQPLQAELRDRALREALFRAATTRTAHGDATDTRELIRRLAALRAERANLLGYPTYAAYTLDDQMARTPEAAIRLLTDLVPAATGRAREEGARMQRIADAEHAGFTLAPWDRQYYAERLRRAEYDLDAAQLRPYLELDRVVRDGVFYAAERLYGITFHERHDIPVYHPDVRVFEVREADGTPFALFYIDCFKRDNKSGGAWMSSFVDQSGLLGARPVVFNVANFTKPAPGQPALLSFDDVVTLFHEFGHALHGLLSNVTYPTLSGTNVPRDFVEFPSQFNEHWALEPDVIAHYARHHETGEPMPAALVERIRRAHTFNQGFALTEYMAAAFLDMGWHTLSPDGAPEDVDAFEAATLRHYGVDLPDVPPRYRSPFFAHIWGGGYGAGYYAYLWAEVLDHDAYAWFEERGGMTRENGQRLRDMILSRGATEPAGALYRAFRGREPRVEPLLVQRGLRDPAAGAALRDGRVAAPAPVGGSAQGSPRR